MEPERLYAIVATRLDELASHHIKGLSQADKALLLAVYAGIPAREREETFYLSSDRLRHKVKALSDLVTVPLSLAYQAGVLNTWIGLHLKCCELQLSAERNQ